MHNQRNLVTLISTLAILVLVGCSGGGRSSPTAPSALSSSGVLQLASADLLVDGQSVNGMTLMPGHGNGEPALFMAELMMDGAPAPGHQVRVQFDRPMGMMGSNRGQFMLYDDGTHGDPTPGDGIYCFLDVEARYGCQGAGMMDGEYHYEVWGQQTAGPDSNHLHLRVWLDQG